MTYAISILLLLLLPFMLIPMYLWMFVGMFGLFSVVSYEILVHNISFMDDYEEAEKEYLSWEEEGVSNVDWMFEK